MQSKITPPAAAKTILRHLSEHHSAYFVGGCVRDALLGHEPHDWDITTSAPPNQVKACLSGYRILDTGLKHGTVTVLVDGESYEVTTFRTEGAYSDHRHPDSVTFASSVEDDLARRDFTMNAIAMNANGSLVDLYGGREDIERGVIRCVGDPDERFREDPLRILRAIRFASQLGFFPTPDTTDSMMHNRHLLASISAERIQSEFSKILLGQRAYRALMVYRKIIAEFIPEIRACFDFQQKNVSHCYDVYEHILFSVNETPANLVLRLTMFFHDIGKPVCYVEDEFGNGHFHGHAAVSANIAKERLRALRYDNATVDTVTQLVTIHDVEFTPSTTFVKRMLNKIGEEQFRRLLKVRKADILAQSDINKVARLDKVENTRAVFERVMMSQQASQLKDLAVSGHDLLALGIPEGPEIGRILHTLLDAVIADQLPNERGSLLETATKLRSEKT